MMTLIYIWPTMMYNMSISFMQDVPIYFQSDVYSLLKFVYQLNFEIWSSFDDVESWTPVSTMSYTVWVLFWFIISYRNILSYCLSFLPIPILIYFTMFNVVVFFSLHKMCYLSYFPSGLYSWFSCNLSFVSFDLHC